MISWSLHLCICPSCRPTNSVKALKAKIKYVLTLGTWLIGYADLRQRRVCVDETVILSAWEPRWKSLYYLGGKWVCEGSGGTGCRTVHGGVRSECWAE